MRQPVVLMFSGQGSQYFRMGQELYEHHARFRHWMDLCAETASPFLGASLTDILYRSGSKGDPFDRILHTNPALLALEFSLAQVLLEEGIRPDRLLGYSLGEIAAAAVAGALPLRDALRLVIRLAELVERKTPPAAMVAILASPEIAAGLPPALRDFSVTGRNFPQSFVMTGPAAGAALLREELRKRSIVFQQLPVNYGFHTAMIDPIEAEFRREIAGTAFLPFRIPVVSAWRCGPAAHAGGDYCWDAVRRPVDFGTTVLRLAGDGGCAFVDCGPSGTLATFVKYLLPPDASSRPLQAMNQYGKDLGSLDKLRASFPASSPASAPASA